MDSLDIGLFIIIFSLLLIVGIIIVFNVVKRKKEENREQLVNAVKQYSRRYKKVCELNSTTGFRYHHIDNPIRERIRFYSKQQYDRHNIESELVLFFSNQENVDKYKHILSIAEENKQLKLPIAKMGFAP